MISSTLLAKYDVPVPRYTSYPTVPHWTEALPAGAWFRSLASSISPSGATIALYVHLPFCESLCTFCGCNTVITRDHGRERSYVALVLTELETYLRHVPELVSRKVTQLHLGGGTPTFFSAAHLAELFDGIRSRVTLPSEPSEFEGSIEADPRVTTTEQLKVLRTLGFTRVSFGVQDVDSEVQRLVNRPQPAELTDTLCRTARALGYESINLDLIYGLPGQTPASMHALARAVLDLRPDRLAVYSFARVPWIKPAQRKFRDDQVPEGADKRALYEIIRRHLLDAGYVEIGLDHFARPGDPLARAAAARQLARNFMGYADKQASVLLGLGVSAISESADCYHQNEKVFPVYERRVLAHEVPTQRGHRLTAEDLRHRRTISDLLTTYRAVIDPEDLAVVRADLDDIVADGLAEFRGEQLVVTAAGIPFLRNIARCFDARQRGAPPVGPLHSKAI
jgi:oxygen-independent coproporphyrinogen-3 oxidase